MFYLGVGGRMLVLTKLRFVVRMMVKLMVIDNCISEGISELGNICLMVILKLLLLIV